MKHLITGGSGFLGQSLSRAILEKGGSVRVYDLAKSDALPGQAEFVPGDIRDRAKLEDATKGCEAVHHLVGLMPQARAPDDIMQAVNVDGTRNALDAAIKAGAKRFVFLSSMEVYGYPKTAPFNEDHPKNPINTYGRNKVEAEAMCVACWKEKGLETVSLRPSTLVGPGINEPTFVMTLQLLEKPPFVMPLPGGGRTRFQMTSVTDCADACVLAAGRPGVAGEAFNIGADDTLTMRGQIEELMTRVGKRAWIVSIPAGLSKFLLLAAYRLGFSKLEPDHISLLDSEMVMDCEKAKHMLGWKPKKTNIDMILESFESYRKEKTK